MTAFTRLESVVLEALVWDLADELPALGAQVRAGKPGRRRNTGFGLFTDIEAPAAAPSSPSGDFGTVHAMVGALRDPIAFKVRVRDGRLLGLVGDSYLQDTRAIDFERVAFDQVFTIDDDGRSAPFVPSVQALHEPERVTPRPVPPQPAPAQPKPRPQLPSTANSSAPRPADPPKKTAAQTTEAQSTAAKTTAYVDSLLDGFAKDVVVEEPTAAERTGLIVGVWAAAFAVATILVLGFEAPLAPVFVLAFIVARYAQRPRGLAAVRRGLVVWRRHLESSKAAR